MSLSNYFLNAAMKKVTTKEKKLEWAFYAAYLTKLTAMQMNDQKAFEEANDNILELLSEDNEHIPPIVLHSIGKEMYKIGINTVGNKNKKQQMPLMNAACQLFHKAANKNFKYSYYYLGKLYERGDIPEGTKLKQAIEFYKAGAALDEASCLFQISL